MSRGLVGTAFQPIIHMRYGFAGSSSKIITDGLAYLHHSYLPPALYNQVIVVIDLGKFGAGTLTPTEVLGKLLKGIELFKEKRDFIDSKARL